MLFVFNVVFNYHTGQKQRGSKLKVIALKGIITDHCLANFKWLITTALKSLICMPQNFLQLVKKNLIPTYLRTYICTCFYL